MFLQMAVLRKNSGGFGRDSCYPYAPQAKRALYAKLATALFLKALR